MDMDMHMHCDGDTTRNGKHGGVVRCETTRRTQTKMINVTGPGVRLDLFEATDHSTAGAALCVALRCVALRCVALRCLPSNLNSATIHP
jgi:hypothetical protein